MSKHLQIYLRSMTHMNCEVLPKSEEVLDGQQREYILMLLNGASTSHPEQLVFETWIDFKV